MNTIPNDNIVAYNTGGNPHSW